MRERETVGRYTERSTGFGVLAAASLALLAACTSVDDGPTTASGRPRGALRPPAVRLEKAAEAQLLNLMEGLRGNDYLGRVKAGNALDRAMSADPAGVAPYLVQLLDEPQLDVRMAVIRLYMKYGRGSPDAVEMLIEVVNDRAMPAALRDDVAHVLRGWTGLDFGYRAWTNPDGVARAGGRWKEWFEGTGGYISAPVPRPEQPGTPPEAD